MTTPEHPCARHLPWATITGILTTGALAGSAAHALTITLGGLL